jgi:hypothetical protein
MGGNGGFAAPVAASMLALLITSDLAATDQGGALTSQ